MASEIVLLVFVALAGPVYAQWYDDPYHHPDPPDYPDVNPKYEFEYAVVDPADGTQHKANEMRNGFITEGRYEIEASEGFKQALEYADHGNGVGVVFRYEIAPHHHDE